MKCPNCQFENPQDSLFCGSCGSSIKIEVICPNCGSKPPSGFKFCNKCGHDLRTSAQTPTIDPAQPRSYTPKHLADKILTERSAVEGERKMVTVLFADVANFTALSEKLDPEEVHQIMDGCFKILMDEIHRHEGTINQFTGDGVMALFGAPVALEDHAGRACHAALTIQKAMAGYGEKIKRDNGLDFHLRIGINSGLVIVGAIGDDLRMDYTAVGDTTNLASRMQSSAQPGTVLVSEATYKLTRDYFIFEPLGPIDIKGKQDPQPAFVLRSAKQVSTRIGAAAAKGLTRFVGRKNSMAALLECFAKVRSGTGQVVAIVGEAGVGKSRLLHEMRNRLLPDQIIYLEGRCLHYGGSIAYLPLLDVLKAYFQIQENDREFIVRKKLSDQLRLVDDVLDGLSPLEDLLSLPVTDPSYAQLEPKLKREKTFEALRVLIIRISQRNPLVLAVEDLHWIDKTSEEFIDYLIGSLARTSILLVLLYRPEYTHRWASKSYYTQIGLDQLGPLSSVELIKAILDEGEAAPELSQLILNRAAGNPLFIEEFTHTLLENGSIEKSSDRYILKRSPSQIQVPDTIQGIIAGRMDRLEDNLKRIMQVASVIGRDFSYRILQTITGLSAELKSYLLNLQGLEFIYEKQLFPELEYIFKHALIQEVAYNSLLVTRRKEIHEKIGKAIEEIYPERLDEFCEILAYHYSRTDRLEKAYNYLKRSAEKAYARRANREALQLYGNAVEVCDRLPRTDWSMRERVEVRSALTLPARTLGYPQESLRFLQEATDLHRELGEVRRSVDYEIIVAQTYAFRGQPHLAVERLQPCFKDAVITQDLDLMARTARDLCLALMILADYNEILDVTAAVIPLIEKADKQFEGFGRPGSTYSVLCGHAGSAMGRLGRFQEAVALCEKGKRFSGTDHTQGTQAFCDLSLAAIFCIKGDGENAVKHAEQSLAKMQQTDATVHLHIIWTVLGQGYLLLGNPEAGRKCVETAMEVQRKADIPYYLPYIYWTMAFYHANMDNIEQALFSVEESLSLARSHREKHFEAEACLLLGWIQALSGKGNLDQIEDMLNQAMLIFEESGAKPSVAMTHMRSGQVNALFGHTEKAVASLKIACGMFQEMGMS